ncbi:MAG: Fic family protein [Gammaproteobacteria bacterium]|nr:Fic family protein [Gammaproteobacteria bacterium]
MKMPLTPPPFERLFMDLLRRNPDQALRATGPLVDGRYLHWDELRHRNPPEGLTHEDWWAVIKVARQGQLKALPFRDKLGATIQFGMPDPVLQALHNIDRRAAGSLNMESPIVSSEDRDRYLVSSLIEEAITSSQLEGAATTREEAKAMLRSGRKPRDRSERMILNNFRAMEHIRDLRVEPFTPQRILELHRIVTADTMDDTSAAGRLRGEGERVQVVDAQHVNVLHDPPEATGLPQRLQALCDFANRADDAEPFVHPVIRAILLHFMLGYDHPFVDGNGRTARAVFYWSLARAGYWLLEYVSISSLLKRAPAHYSRAYLHTKTDSNDTTYFIIHQLGVIDQAIAALYDYLERKSSEQRDAENLLRHAPGLSEDLNHRQVALLSNALRHPGQDYTVESQRRSHRITMQTARTDLLRLTERGLLEQRKRGRAFVFRAPDDLRERITAAASTPRKS